MSVTLTERNAALDRAKALVLAGWTQHRWARSSTGGAPTGISPPTCFCAYGAQQWVARKEIWAHPQDTDLLIATATAMTAAAKKFGAITEIHYNDEVASTKYEVAALFDHAKEMPL